MSFTDSMVRHSMLCLKSEAHDQNQWALWEWSTKLTKKKVKYSITA